jgi:hypothetical protein
LEAGAEALLDLYLLARCDELIIDSSSSFAEVAALLTDAPAARIHDVKQRDKLPPVVRDATNRLMRKLGAHSWAPPVVAKLAWPRHLPVHE